MKAIRDNAYIILVRKEEWKKPIKDLSLDGKIILKRVLKEQNKNMWAEFTCRRIEAICDLLSIR
jgi:hypothetical protein